MAANVKLTITKGDRAGEVFTFTEKESLIIGRAEDCSIVIAEPTVSSYHCMMEILPPAANFRDFGSGNGIKLNGRTVVPGRFKTGKSKEETQEDEVTEFPLKDGDVIALSSKSELLIKSYIPEFCAECLEELEEGKVDRYQNDKGENICEICYDLREIEKADALRAIEEAEAELIKIRREANLEMREERNKCMICDAQLPSGRAQNDARICRKCQENPIMVLEYMFRIAAEGNGEIGDIQGFRKIEELGRGGMGAVFRVVEESTGDMYALKMILAMKNADAAAGKAKFLREASVGKMLDHPNILKHYSYGSSGDAFYILQEICEGGSVDKLIERYGGRLPRDIALDIALQILDALSYSHNKEIEVDLADGTVKTYKGVVHRDIKPGNFFLTGKDKPYTAKLADFGMAKAFEAAGLTDFTRTGNSGGTPVFMPRQQIINYKYAKPDVDVWAVAASLYHMLTGAFPKDFNMNKDIWSQALKNPAVPIRKRDSSIDKYLAEVIDQALTEKPSIGFSTAADFRKALQGAL